MSNKMFMVMRKALRDLNLTNHSISTAIKNDMCVYEIIKKFNVINRKDLFYLNMRNSNVVPKTFIIKNFEDFKKLKVNNSTTWFLKPVNIERGDGILIGNIENIKKRYGSHINSNKRLNTFVLQREIKPHLIDGRKFSLRIWVLVINKQFYMYESALILMASDRYDNDKSNIFAHITNSSLNKKRKGYNLNVIKYTNKQSYGQQYDLLYEKTNEKILTLIKKLKMNYRHKLPKTEKIVLLGVDVLIDQQMDCWLLEANYYPHIGTSGPRFEEFYYPCIRDIIYLYSQLYNIKIPRKNNRNKKHGWLKV